MPQAQRSGRALTQSGTRRMSQSAASLPPPSPTRISPTSTSAMLQAQTLLLLLAKTRASDCAHCQPNRQIHAINQMRSELRLHPAPEIVIERLPHTVPRLEKLLAIAIISSVILEALHFPLPLSINTIAYQIARLNPQFLTSKWVQHCAKENQMSSNIGQRKPKDESKI